MCLSIKKTLLLNEFDLVINLYLAQLLEMYSSFTHHLLCIARTVIIKMMIMMMKTMLPPTTPPIMYLLKAALSGGHAVALGVRMGLDVAVVLYVDADDGLIVG